MISINADTDNTGGETLGSLQYRFVFKNVTTGVTLANVTFDKPWTAAGFNAAQIAAFNAQSLYQDSINFEPSFGAAFDPNALANTRLKSLLRAAATVHRCWPTRLV